MLWPGPSSGWAYVLAALTWDFILIGIMAKVVITVLGPGKGIPVAIMVVLMLVVEAYSRSTTP